MIDKPKFGCSGNSVVAANGKDLPQVDVRILAHEAMNSEKLSKHSLKQSTISAESQPPAFDGEMTLSYPSIQSLFVDRVPLMRRQSHRVGRDAGHRTAQSLGRGYRA